MQLLQLLLCVETRSVTFMKNSLEHEAAKYSKPIQYDVLMDSCMLSTCRFSVLLRLTRELPVLFLDILAADYAVVFPSGC